MRGFLPDQTHLSQVHLRTGNLERALKFYAEVLGLSVTQEPGTRAVLSATPDGPGLIVLSETRNASAQSPSSSGLHHFALRYSNRKELARVYRRVLEAGVLVSGASDHGVSEAIYLSDPDCNRVELCADRPRSHWHCRNGQIAMACEPLNLDALLAASMAEPAKVQALRADLGHIHLRVADLVAAERFYHEFLGLAVTQRAQPGSLFFSAGGYHHHVGVEVSEGKAAGPVDCAGLVAYRIQVPVEELLYCLSRRAPLLGYETRTEPQEDGSRMLQIRDPNGSWLEIQVTQL